MLRCSPTNPTYPLRMGTRLFVAFHPRPVDPFPFSRRPQHVDGDEPYLTSVTAAKAFQYMATILVSIVLVLVVAAALQAAPTTGKLGLAAGVTLVVFSVFQLVAFSLMADVAQKCEEKVPGSACCCSNSNDDIPYITITRRSLVRL